MIEQELDTLNSKSLTENASNDKCVVRLSDIHSELSLFLEDYFRGAYRLTSKDRLTGKTYISVRGLADIAGALIADGNEAIRKQAVESGLIDAAKKHAMFIPEVKEMVVHCMGIC